MGHPIQIPTRILTASRVVAALAKMPDAKALGHICMLLAWVAERGSDRFATADAGRIVEAAALWDGDAGVLTKALVDAEVLVSAEDGVLGVSPAYLPNTASHSSVSDGLRIRLKTPEEREAHMKEQAATFCQQRLEREARVTAKGHVYFIQQGGAGSIKIGYSKNPTQRLMGLQTGHSEPLHMRAMAPGSMAQERALHDRFAHLRVSGEWFRPGEDLIAYMRLVADRRAL